MAVFSHALRRFLFGGHEPFEHKPHDHDGPASASQLQHDARVHKDVFLLTLELLALKQDIEDAEQEQHQVGEVLLPHKRRLQVLIERYQHMKTFFESRNEEDNLELVVARIKRMESGIEEIDQQMGSSAEAIEKLRSVHDGIVRKIMRTAQIRSVRRTRPSESGNRSLITERMMRRDDIQKYEKQAAEIEEDMEAEASERFPPDSDDSGDALSFTSENAEEQERIELQIMLGRLRTQRAELEHHPGSSAAGEIDALTHQIIDLGDEIAIRGTPCVKGSLIFKDDFDASKDNGERMVVNVSEDVNSVSDLAAGPPQEVCKELTGPGLFDGVVDIEVPENRGGSDDETTEMESKKAERMKRAMKRVATWVSQLEADDKGPQSDANHNVLDDNFEGMDKLDSVMVGESDSVYNQDLTDFTSVILRCRIDSWYRICERHYQTLDAAVQVMHPRGMVTR